MQDFHGLSIIDMGVLPNCSFIREKVDSRQFVSTITVSVTALPLAVWTVYTVVLQAISSIPILVKSSP